MSEEDITAYIENYLFWWLPFVKILLLVKRSLSFYNKTSLISLTCFFTAIWINSDKFHFSLKKMKLHLQNELCNEQMSKVMQITSRSMWSWFTINAKIKSREFFEEEKGFPVTMHEFILAVLQPASNWWQSKTSFLKFPRFPKQYLIPSFFWSCLCCQYYNIRFFI